MSPTIVDLQLNGIGTMLAIQDGLLGGIFVVLLTMLIFGMRK